MTEMHIVPDEGTTTDERLCNSPAKVWWQKQAALAFPSAADRWQLLAPLEDTMNNYCTTALYYHAEDIEGHHVTYATTEEDGCIYVEVSLSEPMLVEGFDLDAFLTDNGLPDEEPIH